MCKTRLNTLAYLDRALGKVMLSRLDNHPSEKLYIFELSLTHTYKTSVRHSSLLSQSLSKSYVISRLATTPERGFTYLR
jgi:hypothetical protein